MLRAWSFDGTDRRVICTLPVVNQISSAARDGFLSFRHGGMEVGGILVGTQRGTVTRIVEARPLAISHGRGAQFLLTDADHQALAELIRNTNTELAPRRLEVVGSYESRTRRDLSAAGVESETFAMHFPVPGQVCLILKLGHGDVASAVACVRDEQANIIVATSVEDLADLSLEHEAPSASQPVMAAAVTADAAQVTEPLNENVTVLRPAGPAPANRVFVPETYDVPRMYVSPGPNRKWKYAAGSLAIAVCIGSVSMLRDRRDQPVPVTAAPAPSAPVPAPLPPPPQPVSLEEDKSAKGPALTQRSRAKPKTNRSKRARQRSKTTRRTTR
jgi:hypothetical protein